MAVATEDEREVEVAVIGCKDSVGLSASGYTDGAFIRLVAFASAVSRYREALTRTCIPSVACTAMNSTERRCARIC